MEYKQKKVIEEIDVLEITQDEFNATNDMYKEALILEGFPVKYVRELKLKKIILTDGLHRKEFMLQVNNDAVKGREAATIARHKFLETIDKAADEEQKQLIKERLS